VDAHSFRITSGAQFATSILEIADQLLLFCINRDGGLSGALELCDLLVDVLKLGVAVRMRCTLARLLAVAATGRPISDWR
jgi:hypothetical protein